MVPFFQAVIWIHYNAQVLPFDRQPKSSSSTSVMSTMEKITRSNQPGDCVTFIYDEYDKGAIDVEREHSLWPMCKSIDFP